MKLSKFIDSWVEFAQEKLAPMNTPNSFNELVKNEGFIQLMEKAPCMVFAINHVTSRYDFFSKNVVHYLGYTSEEMLQGGVPFGMSLIDDTFREITSSFIIPKMFEFFNTNIGMLEQKKLQVSYPLKIRRKNGELRWVQQNVSVLEHDSNGVPLLSLVFMSDITDIKKDESIEFIVSKLNSENYYHSIHSVSYPKNIESGLSARELEVLIWLSKGKTSEEIGSVLEISAHTVRNHRKNILRKMEVENTARLIEVCKRNGII